MLAQHAVDSDEYRRHYRARDEYKILDNGAHETGVPMELDALLKLCRDVRADELVMPDVPGNALSTRGMIEDALHRLVYSPIIRDLYVAARAPRLMYVPHGRTFHSWKYCLESSLECHVRAERERPLLGPPVIALAKMYLERSTQRGRATARKYYKAIRDAGDEIMGQRPDVHLLGWPRALWILDELMELDADHGMLRSVDSARPFVYAHARVLLEPGGTVPYYPGRDLDYFDRVDRDERYHELAQRNIEVFRAAASGGLIR